MKEQEFLNWCDRNGFIKNTIEVKIYYTIDDNGDVILDADSITEEFENTLDEIEGNLI